MFLFKPRFKRGPSCSALSCYLLTIKDITCFLKGNCFIMLNHPFMLTLHVPNSEIPSWECSVYIYERNSDGYRTTWTTVCESLIFELQTHSGSIDGTKRMVPVEISVNETENQWNKYKQRNIPSVQWNCPTVLAENQFQNTILPPLCFTVWMLFFGSYSGFTSCKHDGLRWCHRGQFKSHLWTDFVGPARFQVAFLVQVSKSHCQLTNIHRPN